MSGGTQPPVPDPDDDLPQFDPLAALGGFDLQDVLRMLQTPGPVNWEVARQCATSLAAADPSTGVPLPEDSIDPSHREELLDLARLAQTHVAARTGLTEVGAVPVLVVGRNDWTRITLEGLRPVVEALSISLTQTQGPALDLAALFADPAAAAEQPELLAGLLGTLAPLLFGVQAGSLVGLLAQHALGQHDLPLPLAGPPQLAFLLANIDTFASDWAIEPRDLYLSLALREVVRSAPRSVAWVRDRLVRLSSEYVSAYEMRPEVLEERFGELLGDQLAGFDPEQFDLASIDPSDPSTFPELPHIDLDPGSLLDGLRSPAQEPIRAELVRFAGVLEGYADVVVAEIAASVSPGSIRVDEALRRHRVEQGRHTRFVEQMLGLALDREQYDAGHAFCSGVTERAGLEGLNRLWEREAHLPTVNEYAAPGLWLARLELDL